MTDDDYRDRLYESVLNELDLGYVDIVATEIRAILDDGRLAEIDYQPGDGTRYPMTLIPLGVAEKIGDWVAWPGTEYRTGVLVALGGSFGRCYAVNLLGRHPKDYLHYSYVAEHWFGRDGGASAVAVALLLEAVAGVERHDPRAT